MALRLIILSLLVAGSLGGSSLLRIDPTSSWRVIGGGNAPDNLYPYQVSLQHNGKHDCGGTIVHPEYVITAAHCVQGATPGLTVSVGLTKLTQKGTTYKVLRVQAHDEYDPWKTINDVAILKVEPITFNNKVSKIRVETEFVKGDVPVTLTGWGSIKLWGPTPDHLQHIELKTITNELCNSQHDRDIYDTQICTLTKSGEGACHGDSGGPLVEHKGGERVLVGIVSYGKLCARGTPDVFARVSSYIDWFNIRCQKCLNK